MKIFMSMLLVLVLLFSVAYAEGQAYEAYATTNVNLRAEPGESDILAIVYAKMPLTVIGESGSWFKVEWNGITGYVYKAYISIGTEEAYAGEYSVTYSAYATTRLNMRKGPATSYDIVKVIPEWERVTVVGIAVDWYKVSYQGTTGYVCGSYLSTSKKNSSSGGSTSSGQSSGTTMTTTTRVHLRRSSTKDSESLGVLPEGARVTVSGSSGGWYKVTYQGLTGYVCGSYLTRSNSSSGGSSSSNQSRTTMTTTTRVHIRKSAGKDSTSLGVLPEGARVTLIKSGCWAYVEYKGQKGYVYSAYLK